MSAGVAGRPLVGCHLFHSPLGRVSGGDFWRLLFAQTVALELEAMSIVDDAVEDGVSVCRVAEHGAMP
jgi:hypothetical protein